MAAFRKVRLNWRLKSVLFHIFDKMPFGQLLYFLVQKKLTRTVPRRLSPTAETASCFIEHADAMKGAWGGSLAGRRIFEFGAGWDLYSNLVLWCYGADDQVVYDLVAYARRDEINFIIRHLAKEPPPGAGRVPQHQLRSVQWRPELKARYGIDYIAPADASRTPYPAGSFDAAVTTSVFEHLPPSAIDRLLAEGIRMLRPGGVMLHAIDYSDHYSHSDSAIGGYNFLRFSDAIWRMYNPPIHFQNRFRHVDYVRIFARHGLSIQSERCYVPPEATELIGAIELHASFRGRPLEELSPTFGYFMLRSADPALENASLAA